ncbi:citrate transporter [Lapidilactobacillus luobeiensis]|uniref:citrate transporter n=1 Tax=Lapidilactobacillus luobeiensis TaxID=2950371 RepID=UPI0021C3BA2D|nr:citrate transporter [Lapidilactobacillus luobeiensis]
MDTLQLFQIIGILVVFFAFVGLMMTKKLATILALPLMAILMALIAGIPLYSNNPKVFNIATNILSDGSAKLATTIITTFFGAWFGFLLKKTGISEGIIRKAAEMAGGDKPVRIATIFFLIGIVIFSTGGGLGMTILAGTIIIPILLTAGISALTASIVLLASQTVGSFFSMSGWSMTAQLYKLPVSVISKYTIIFTIPAIILFEVMLIWFIKRDKTIRKGWTMPDAGPVRKAPQVRTIALIAPILPVVMVFAFKLDIISSILLAVIATILLTTPKHPAQVMVSALIEGIQSVAGAAALMVGIGMLLAAVTAPAVSAILTPLIKAVLPTSPITYVLFFSILSPLALYRGPLNTYGLGSGVGVLMAASGLSPLATMLAMRNLGKTQGLCDPTNTYNVWVADFADVDVNDITKKTIGWATLVVFVSQIMAAFIAF